jgi:hypothetical protein
MVTILLRPSLTRRVNMDKPIVDGENTVAALEQSRTDDSGVVACNYTSPKRKRVCPELLTRLRFGLV